MPSSGQSRIYKEQMTSADTARQVFASGARLLMEAGSSGTFNGALDMSGANIILPGVLRTGFIDLPLGDAWEVSSADSLNALTSGTNPAFARVNAGTDPKGRIVWTSGTGGADPIQWDVHIPSDVATASPLVVSLYGEVSSAVVNGFNVDVRFGVGDNNAGATVALTTTPGNRTVNVASGDIIANVPAAIIVNPVSSTGTVSLYGARLTYTRLTS